MGRLIREPTVIQKGLFETDPKMVEKFVARVTAFNLNSLASPVKMDIIPYEKGDAQVDAPHYKIRLSFPNKDVFKLFWTS